MIGRAAPPEAFASLCGRSSVSQEDTSISIDRGRYSRQQLQQRLLAQSRPATIGILDFAEREDEDAALTRARLGKS
jgi:hypothetical protein